MNIQTNLKKIRNICLQIDKKISSYEKNKEEMLFCFINEANEAGEEFFEKALIELSYIESFAEDIQVQAGIIMEEKFEQLYEELKTEFDNYFY